MFTAAHALLDNDISGEAAILGTLAFAWSDGAWPTSPDDYGGLELLGIADGVPVLKLPDITVEIITYDDSQIARAIRIDVYAQSVTPKKVAETYRELLENYKIHYDKCGGGSVAWDLEDHSLTLTVRAMKELSSFRVPMAKAYPPGRIYSFPPPALVSGFFDTLRGSTNKKTFSGYSYALAESGRHTPQKAVTGSVAWLLGERDDAALPPRERRPSIAKTLNKHLLTPRDEPKLPEDYWTPDDTLWRDARTLSQRLLRILYYLQEHRKQQFPRSTV